MTPIHRLALAGAALALAQGCAPVAAVGAGSAVVVSVAQERGTLQALTDTEIAASLQYRLGEHSGELYRDVLVDVVEARVTLTGSVPSRDEKIEASRIAWATPGVLEVTDELDVAEDSGTSAYLNDVWISSQLRYQLLTDVSVASVNYNVTTVDGTVHLTGLARSRRELSEVIGIAQSVPGVRRVVSHVLAIDDPRRLERLSRKTG